MKTPCFALGVLLLSVAATTASATSSLSSSSIPAWATTSTLARPPLFPAPSASLSLVVYGAVQSTCLINSTTTTVINNWCAVQTPALVTAINSCTLFSVTPALPASTASTGLAYMFDSSYNLNIYSVSASGSVSCSASNLLINMTNPQWNYASSCSTRSLTTYYQFGYQNGQAPVTNGSMLMDASGQGYGVCPYGYFWPTQPACAAQPSVSTTVASLPLNSSNQSPSFVAPACSVAAQSASYSMALTVGVNNACPTGCDGTSFRVCMNSLRVCLNTAGRNLNQQCVCFQDGLNLCAKVANTCPDSYIMFAMNQNYQQAVSACTSVGMSLTLSFQSSSSSSSSACTDCSPAIAFAVVFALLFGGLLAYIGYFRYYAYASQPLQQMRQTALSR